jgi:hypothetical protein
MVIQEGITIKGKSLREHFETHNHDKAIDYLFSIVNEYVFTQHRYTFFAWLGFAFYRRRFCRAFTQCRRALLEQILYHQMPIKFRFIR